MSSKETKNAKVESQMKEIQNIVQKQKELEDRIEAKFNEMETLLKLVNEEARESKQKMKKKIVWKV